MQDSTWKENEDLPSLPSKATDNMNGHQQASNSCIYARTKLPAEEWLREQDLQFDLSSTDGSKSTYSKFWPFNEFG